MRRALFKGTRLPYCETAWFVAPRLGAAKPRGVEEPGRLPT